MTLFEAVLTLAMVLCALVAGFLFGFAVVVMPGIRNLDDSGFIRAFQVIDGVIQKGQPVFGFVWLGSALALVAAALVGLWTLDGAHRLLVIVAVLVYILGVQAPTFGINVPMNNKLQQLDPGTMDAPARRRAREGFEARWNRWNVFRTVCATLTTVLLAILLLRM